MKGTVTDMTVNSCEIKDEKSCSGCRVALLLVRYPEIEGKEKLSTLFRSKSESFSKFVREKAFQKAEAEFNSFMESGGRRSLFPQKEYRMSITITSEHGRYISVKDEIISVSGGIIKSYALDIRTWDVETETVCGLSDFISYKPKAHYDGFYLRGGRPTLYSVNDLWKNGECRMRDVKRFFSEIKAPEANGVRKRSRFADLFNGKHNKNG